MTRIVIDVYCDEINRVRFISDSSIWMYIGMLFVPLNTKRMLLNELLNTRCIQNRSWRWDASSCPHQCGYHQRNDTEIHYSSIHRTSARFMIGHSWVKDFLIERNNLGNRGLVYFNILGLNLTNMDLECFGENRSRDLTIYNRFFRTALKGGAKYFFAEYDRIIVRVIYHDRGSQESHDLFPWYSGYRINLEDDDKLSVQDDEVEFVDSDHRVYSDVDGHLRNESQFVQFVDLILGSVFCCLHDPSEREEKKRIGLAMKPLLRRLLERPRNVNSSFNYHRKQQVSFFPVSEVPSTHDVFQQLDLFGNQRDFHRFTNGFYTQRPILLQPIEQTTLDAGW